MKTTCNLILGVFATLTIIGIVTTSVQQVLAVQDPENKVAFKKLTKQFQRDVLSLMSDPPRDADTQLAMLFHDYEQATFRLFGLTPP